MVRCTYLIDSVIIINTFIMSDYRPLVVHFNCDVGAVTICQSNNLTEYVVQWASLNSADKCRYKSKTEEQLQAIGTCSHQNITLY